MAEIDASATISAGPTTLYGVEVVTDGNNNAVVIGYNKTSSDGIGAANKVFEFTVTAANHYGGRNWIPGIRCDTGLYVTVAGTGASAIINNS
ncbi:MAG: hypothetical protein DRH26_11755 [Deltaproteobacteria bacterium]|nr:MAG: hypothetical protein DRH26_11755 [Deltaproteobacteria bacterium]